MKELPKLGPDALLRLSRQGGFAAIHALARPREIDFSSCNEDERGRICSVLERSLPASAESVGRGDQRYYKIELRFKDKPDEITITVPEDRAPNELVRLWDKGDAKVP
ncbi:MULTISPECIES: protealysin inhibitor emfourin [Pseudomonas]|jgi:hypothetical protein|uniref:Uncharacterized protein n=2 Tax=Pseudomonas TaxID=286 RepID=A0A2X2CRH2_PSELU|nr:MULTISPECIES: protealysin inhibitor emfourin [Pseudomonas]AYN95291.1 hypothetical protein EAW52_15630 [Pseudomonas sp. LTJR-52]ENA31952.1 hypothetical protein HMPREF1487_07385 [Pseudomonas sp. HPB0071]MBA1249347.1 hypothetical protein [Pseudomonas zeshuii]MBF8639149.1 hypothetical protein [Pseudomonas zeshuii]MBH3440087.1 hypothetical protein [Pseudomonas luteola]